ncbi:glycosyltransferase [Saccharothrix sp. NRRL B-16314]|uniref:glycosyltransferase n=1 Tax=Saccharothrix sp. NRRL B-16314 TaxID=1463825 RepID=UPI000525871D|nr:glycosyltransferase [Saccharothrix sp. NRRL B-16314]
MKILIYAWGSRGDVQPYLALARALNEAGHESTLAAPAPFESFAAEHGVRFFPRDDTQLHLLERDDVRTLMYKEASRVLGTQTKAEKKEFKAEAKELMSGIRPIVERTFVPMLEEQFKAAEYGPDLIVPTHDDMDYGHFVAEKVGVPHVVAELYPFYTPSWHYPSMAFQEKEWPGLFNRLSHVLPKVFIPMKRKADRWRTESLGLPARRGRHNRMRTADGRPVHLLNLFSEHLFPRASDWPDNVHSIGSPLLPVEKQYTPPESLVRFLAAGPPPIAIGFGSLSNPDPHRNGRMVSEAVRAAGVRAVVIRGSGRCIEIEEPSDDIVVVDSVPFDWLCPKIRAMVHSGGHGVVHDVLAAGIPSVSCPLFKESALWGNQVRKAGAGLEPLWQPFMTTENLTTALRRLATDDTMAAAARRMSEKIKSEPGHAAAVSIIEQVAAGKVPAAV